MDAEVVRKILAVIDRFPVESDTLLGAIAVVEIAAGISGAPAGDIAIFTASEIQARRTENEGRALDFGEVSEVVRRWSGMADLSGFDTAFRSWEQWRRWRTRAPPS